MITYNTLCILTFSDDLEIMFYDRYTLKVYAIKKIPVFTHFKGIPIMEHEF